MNNDYKKNYSFSEEIYNIASNENIKKEFENYFKNLAQKNYSGFFCHHVFDRNTIGNDLYKNFCLLKMQESGLDISSHIEDIFTYMTFSRTKHKIKKFFYIKFFLKLIFLFFKNIYYKIIYIISLIKKKYIFKSKLSSNIKSSKYVIFTFVDEGILIKDKFVDRYFPRLCELGEVDKKEVILITVLVGTACKNIYLEKIKKEFQNSFIPEQLVSVLDMLKLYIYDFKIIFQCFFYILFVRKLKNSFDFIILKELLVAQPVVGGVTCCGEGIIKQLKKMGVHNLKIFLNSFENLVYEKRCNLALRKYFPKCVIIGTQHSTIIDTQLSNWPLDVEIKSGLCPDVVLSNGPKYINVLKKMLSVCENNIIQKIGPTLRYSNHLYKKTSFKRHFEKQYCLLLGSIDPYLTLRSIAFVMNYIGRVLPTMEIIFKNHPMCSFERLKEHINHTYLDIDIVKKIHWLENTNYNLEDLIFNATYVFSYSQGSILDIMSLGRTPILIGSENSITMVPIIDEEFKKFLKIIFDEKDLEKLLMNFQDNESDISIKKIKNWYDEFYLESECMPIKELFFGHSK